MQHEKHERLTLVQASKMMGVTPTALGQAIVEGRCPFAIFLGCKKQHNSYFISKTRLESWLKATDMRKRNASTKTGSEKEEAKREAPAEKGLLRYLPEVVRHGLASH